jgi:hypothetical protein
VAGVAGVPVAVVHVVDVIPVGHGDVPARSPMLMVMVSVGGVPAGLALIRMGLVDPVDVAVVGVVGVTTVLEGDMAAALAVGMRVICVCCVLAGAGHREFPPSADTLYHQYISI